MQQNIASAKNGGIAVVQTGNGEIRIWLRDVDALKTLRGYAEELDITEQALATFFKLVGDQPIAADLLESRLSNWAQRYRRILQDLDSFRPDLEPIEAIRREAIEAVKSGDLDGAADLFNRAYATWCAKSSAPTAEFDKTTIAGAELLRNKAELAILRQRYAEAMEIFREACDQLPPRLGGPTARCKRAWGIAEFEWGRFSNAYQILLDAHELDLEAWGREPNAVSALAAAARELGKHEEAEKWLLEAIDLVTDPIQQAAFSIELSSVFREAGNLRKAQEFVGSAANILRDQTHQSNQRIRLKREVARLCDELGDAAKGLQEIEQAWQQAQVSLPPTHPLARRVALDYAGLLWRNGQLGAAEDRYRELGEALESEYGPEHPESVTVLDHRGALYMERGRFAEAAEVLKLGCAVAKKRLPRDHPDRAQALNNLGRALLNLGQFEAACDNFDDAEAIFRLTFGRGHKDRATALANRAVALFRLGRLDEALTQGNVALRLREAALGSSHPDVAESLATLGALHHQRDELDAAEKLLAQGQQIYESIAPNASGAFSQLLFNQASVYLDSSRPALAAKSTERALSLALPIFGEDHPNIVQFLETLAVAQALTGESARALETLERATTAAGRLWAEEHSVARRLGELKQHVASGAFEDMASGPD
jgi:hypothetical protein